MTPANSAPVVIWPISAPKMVPAKVTVPIKVVMGPSAEVSVLGASTTPRPRLLFIHYTKKLRVDPCRCDKSRKRLRRVYIRQDSVAFHLDFRHRFGMRVDQLARAGIAGDAADLFPKALAP